MRLTQPEIDSLIAKYRTGTANLVDYAAFCDQINQVFTEAASPTQVIAGAKSSATFSDAEKEAVLQHVSQMIALIKAHRILLKPSFQDFDRSQSLHVTAHQFLRVLKSLGLMPPSQAVFDLLIRKYCDLGSTAEVNYFKFCQDLDRPQDIFPEYVPKRQLPEPVNTQGVTAPQKSTFFAEDTKAVDVVANRFSEPRVDLSCDPSDVEERIRSCVVMKRVRIEEFFLDFDKLRKGRVTQPQFRSILSQLGFTLTNEEYAALAAKYLTRDQEQFFDYVAFCASINRAFTTSGIQKDPLARVAPVTENETVLARRKFLASEQVDLEPVLAEYKRAVATRRILLKPVF